jgi:hypothetical protein
MKKNWAFYNSAEKGSFHKTLLECPHCGTLCDLNVLRCPVCGYIFVKEAAPQLRKKKKAHFNPYLEPGGFNRQDEEFQSSSGMPIYKCISSKPKKIHFEFPNRRGITVNPGGHLSNCDYYRKQTISIIFSYFQFPELDKKVCFYLKSIEPFWNDEVKIREICRRYFDKYGPSTLSFSDFENRFKAFSGRRSLEQNWSSAETVDGLDDNSIKKQDFERLVNKSRWDEIKNEKQIASLELREDELRDLLEKDTSLTGAIVYLSNKLYKIPVDVKKAQELKRTLLVNLFYSSRFSVAYDALWHYFSTKMLKLKAKTGSIVPEFCNMKPLGFNTANDIQKNYRAWLVLSDIQKLEKALNVQIVSDPEKFISAFVNKMPKTEEDVSLLPGLTTNLFYASAQIKEDLKLFDGFVD